MKVMLTLGDLVKAVQDSSHGDDEVVQVISHLITTHRVAYARPITACGIAGK